MLASPRYGARDKEIGMRRVGLLCVIGGLALAVAAVAVDAPPVMLDLGPLKPTPAPTPEAANRKRLITTLTVQNIAGGDSVMSFEATDVADTGKGKFRTIAAARYSLRDDNPKLQPLRQKIIGEIRSLESDLLEYAKISGPPKEHRPLLSASSSSESEKADQSDTADKPETPDKPQTPE